MPYNQAQHNHNSYTKIPKKIYQHNTKITTLMCDTFIKLQTSKRRSNRSNHKIASYRPTVQIWAQSNGKWVKKVNFTKTAQIWKKLSRPTTKELSQRESDTKKKNENQHFLY